MQPVSSFNSNLSIAIATVGGAGVGKTTLGLRLFPKTYANVSDLNFKSGLDYLTKIGELSNVVGYDTPLVRPDGTPVPANQRYDLFWKQVNGATKNPLIDTIFIDSGTFVEDILKAKICNATSDAAIRLSGYDQWGSLALTWKALIMELRQSGKKIIFSFHEEKEKDESDQIFKYKIAVDGKTAAKIPALFSDVWRCEIQETNGKHAWMVRTLGNVRQEHLKNTFSLPAVLPADELVKLVRAKV